MNGKYTILYVDDNPTSLMLLKERLEDEYNIICVKSGKIGLDTLKKRGIDLIISDLRMPGISGMTLLEQVKQNHPKTKMIIMSSMYIWCI
jgi:CheY-like chemotaxis protein